MKYSILSLVAIIGLASCEEAQLDGTNSTTTGYSMKMQSTDASNKFGELNFTSAYAVVTEVELERESESEGVESESEIDITGNFRVDLMTGESMPEFPTVEVEAGEYDELEVTIGSEDLSETAIFLEGEYETVAGITYSFEIELVGELELEIEDENGITIEANDVRDILVSIDLNTIMSSMDFDNASVNSNGVIVISAQSNEDLYAQFIAMLDVEVEADDE
ncbi:DUF4382 domain-containing protein [Phaeocystidibacter luteus]|uniref:DUF4382 domain-containing protein n=1 Tax=Phaeocystidibacter luteus TaxID=911197 RepID=A0A6N6RKD0_9FLAO|nr:DUF4382 domain-containing protein [Phaeocystidibacter luteus]KAB2805342.1 DUF4382 domain-containing protein [Phaeocystidibacter luteus]